MEDIKKTIELADNKKREIEIKLKAKIEKQDDLIFSLVLKT